MFLLKRMSRSNATFQLADRRIDTITQIASGGSFSTDPETGDYRCKLWGSHSDPDTAYPDLGTLTCTVQASGGAAGVWDPAIDKYSFILGAEEYSPDIFQNQIESDGTELEDAVYIVFNTPPFSLDDIAIFNYGTINPQVKFNRMQPIIDSYSVFKDSLFSYEQWLDPNSRIRSRKQPNRLLVAFPGTLMDFKVTDGGLIRQMQDTYWTVPPPYGPKVQEHDILVRESSGQRFQIIDLTPIYVEDILVSQHFSLSEYDPKSSVYDIEVQTV